jgi:hypothetical protein
MMFCVIDSKILTPWSPIQVIFWGGGSLYVSQWYLMSIAFDLFCLMVSFKVPTAVELSARSCVTGWMWPNSVSVTLGSVPLWAFWKHDPTSDSAAEGTTFLMTDATLRIDPFRVPYFVGLSPQKNNPPRWICDF